MLTFKFKCKEYFSDVDINRLRTYARSIGVARATKKTKPELIDAIIAVLSGEQPPEQISKKGAPVKNDQVDKRIVEKIASIKAECFANDVMVDIPDYDFERRYQEVQNQQTVLRVADPRAEEEGFVSEIVSRGQIEYIDGEYLLLPLDCAETDGKTPIPMELIAKYRLREGDVITCKNREKDGNETVAVLLTVNDVWAEDMKERPVFEECSACYSKERFCVFDKEEYFLPTQKYIDWLMPIAKGQRGCVISAPKAGKTKFLLQTAQAAQALNERVETFALLIDQSYETVGEFRKIFKASRLFYTTYEDDAERQVFVADFVMKRAKRYAELGKNVLIVVDSLNALARAFNDTEASLGGKTLACGLESKTVHYIKKYFGSARCLERGGSITLLGAVSVETGNPMDEVIARELSELATWEVSLSNELAMKRIYPAIDLEKGCSKQGERVKNEKEEELEFLLRNELLAKVGAEGVLKLLSDARSFEEFASAVEKLLY